MTQETTQPSKEYTVFKDKVYVKKEAKLYNLWNEVSIPKHAPYPEWKGAKLPFQIWTELVAWCQVTQKKFKSEAMALLFYNVEENDWQYWIPPQKTAGMTVETDANDPRYSKERVKYHDLQFGTVHHHCTMSAFQSGTDHSDEIDREGFHFTIGKLNEKKLDIHARLCLEGSSYDIPVHFLVDMPDWAQNVPAHYQTQILKEAYSRPVDNVLEWDEYFKEEIKKVSTRYSMHGSNSPSVSYRPKQNTGSYNGQSDMLGEYWNNIQGGRELKKTTEGKLIPISSGTEATPDVEIEGLIDVENPFTDGDEAETNQAWCAHQDITLIHISLVIANYNELLAHDESVAILCDMQDILLESEEIGLPLDSQLEVMSERMEYLIQLDQIEEELEASTNA
jgi:hypothetical protein